MEEGEAVVVVAAPAQVAVPVVVLGADPPARILRPHETCWRGWRQQHGEIELAAAAAVACCCVAGFMVTRCEGRLWELLERALRGRKFHVRT